jgi:hypothetical protein
VMRQPFSVLRSGPTSLLACNRASLFFYGTYVFIQYIDIVSIDQELMYSIQFQSFLLLLDLPGDILYSKFKYSGDKEFHFFIPF